MIIKSAGDNTAGNASRRTRPKEPFDVPHPALPESSHPAAESARSRRALIFADVPTAASLEQQLTAADYETLIATNDRALEPTAEFVPDIVLVEVGGDENGDRDRLALARRLRAEPKTFALPLVFLFHEDARSLRSAALNIGADDYFSLITPATEMWARLDALFWRAEAGRRASPIVGEQRAEIDNFMLLLDAIRADAESGTSGAIALVEAVAREHGLGRTERDRTLAEAYGFLKLNLRRIDATAFYGPTTLLVYVPRTHAQAALARLTQLRHEFLQSRPNVDIAIGIAFFPEDGSEVGSIIEKAEGALKLARVPDADSRVNCFTTKKETDEPERLPNSHAINSPENQMMVETATSNLHKHSLPGLSAGHAKDEVATRHGVEVGVHQRHASGTILPPRLLLTVSEPSRMAQLNLLLRSAGYQVRAAFDGEQALNLLRIERPDLLLLDYELHGINGIETLRRLRQQSGGSLLLPVVLLAPPQPESVSHEAIDLGARSVVMMPYDSTKLLDSVRIAGSDE